MIYKKISANPQKKLLDFFINHVFVGVFQYDSGTPKHALELKKGLKWKHMNLLYARRQSTLIYSELSLLQVLP